MEIDDKRLLPEEFLDIARREEDLQTSGHLKIFLGMAAGVGKTYAMLEEAHNVKAMGRDPVIGLICTHGRHETEELIRGLKKIPEKTVSYKGKEFQELDLEAILSLKPDLVLIDELAHTNIPGMRHTKRWQDVMEILENGIDVYTTLNVQHIESLNDIIQGIVGTSVRETVPDLVIEKASAIRLVDLPPDELLQRLKEGKVYLGDQSKVAIEHFFHKDRLTALREIVLRYAAEKVHRDLRELPPMTETRIDWKPREKFLVAVSPSPHSQKLIRTARRLAAYLNAPWIALNIDTGKYMSEEDAEQLEKNLTLARNLGAEVLSITNPSIVEGIKFTAREKGVTQIIIGRPPRTLFSAFTRVPLIDQLAAECRDIDIHVIRQDRYNLQFNAGYFSYRAESPMMDYVWSFLAVAGLTGVNYLLYPFVGDSLAALIFFVGILLLNFVLTPGPVFFAGVLIAVFWASLFRPDFFFTGFFVIAAGALGIWQTRANQYKDLLFKSQKNSEALFEIIKAIASSEDPEHVLAFIKKSFGKLMHGTVDIAIRRGKEIDTTLPLLDNEQEKGAFLWSLHNGKESGLGTDTLGGCKNLYIPLMIKDEPVGMLIYRPHEGELLSTPEKKVMNTACKQIAMYVNRMKTGSMEKETEELHQIEKVHGMLLERFSLLFGKPIEQALKAVEALKGTENQKEKIQEIENSLETVSKTFSNVSAMSQLIEGLIPLEREMYRPDQIVLECCESIQKTYPNTPVEFVAEGVIPVANLDYYLIKILVYNVLIYSVENSKPGSKVIVRLKGFKNRVILTCLSQTQEPVKESDLFSNSAMGLTFAKTIAEVHGGTLTAENVDGGKILFTFTMPLG